MLAPWYTYPVVNNYGVYPDPEGPYPKPDINVQVPTGVPITSLGSGVVSGINSPTGIIPSWGQVVTIKLDNPLNNIATHMAYLHLNSVNTGLRVGQKINVGDVLGYSGPSVSGANIGFALYNGDYYGYGPSWNTNVGSQALNPTDFFNSITGGGGNNSTLVSTVNNNQLLGNDSTGNNPLTNVIGGFDFTRFIDATLLFILGITLLIVGFLLISGKFIENNAGTIAKVASVA